MGTWAIQAILYKKSPRDNGRFLLFVHTKNVQKWARLDSIPLRALTNDQAYLGSVPVRLRFVLFSIISDLEKVCFDFKTIEIRFICLHSLIIKDNYRIGILKYPSFLRGIILKR